jgi:hypothetical protein
MDPVKLSVAMSARFSSKDPKSQFSGVPNENILDYIQEYKLALREYDYLSPSIQIFVPTSSSAQALSLSLFIATKPKTILRSTIP